MTVCAIQFVLRLLFLNPIFWNHEFDYTMFKEALRFTGAMMIITFLVAGLYAGINADLWINVACFAVGYFLLYFVCVGIFTVFEKWVGPSTLGSSC